MACSAQAGVIPLVPHTWATHIASSWKAADAAGEPPWEHWSTHWSWKLQLKAQVIISTQLSPP